MRHAVSDIVSKVKDFLNEYNVNGTILCALSGGCDSVVMTHIIAKLYKEKVVAIHLNHNWRGDESKRDEEFSLNFANSLGIKFYSQTLGDDVKKTEAAAREARYNFFLECAKKFNSSFVMLAHNKNDNAETLLYRVIKGTGLRGLCSISKNREIFYRPLLDVTRDEIEDYALKNNLKYVQDSSNSDTTYARNLIRKEILPKMYKINPDTLNAINSLINLSKMQYQIVLSALKSAKDLVMVDDKIILDKFLELDEALQYEIMNDFIGSELKYRDFKRIKSYVDFVKKKSGRKSINSELFLEVSYGEIYKCKKEDKNNCEVLVDGAGEYFLNGKKIVIEQVKSASDFKKDDGWKYLKSDFSCETLLRTRREGDVFVPFGMKSGKMKLKEYFINKKISRQKRDNLILLTNKNEVLCILGMQISQNCAVSEGDSCYRIKIWE